MVQTWVKVAGYIPFIVPNESKMFDSESMWTLIPTNVILRRFFFSSLSLFCYSGGRNMAQHDDTVFYCLQTQ